MPKVIRDYHGLYIRAQGHVFRPQLNHTARRDHMSLPPAVRSVLPGSTTLTPGSYVKFSSPDGNLGVVTEYQPSTGKREGWSNHGPWTGKSEESWFAYSRDMDDEAWAKYLKDEERASRMNLQELVGLFKLLFIHQR